MTVAQIYAILALLSAFGVPQPIVDTVQGILNASITQQVSVPEVPVALSEGIGGVGAPFKVSTSTADIKVNGSDGLLTVDIKDCKNYQGLPCANVAVSWDSVGIINPGCGIIGGTPWSGNYGLSGTKDMQLVANETNSYVITLECSTVSGIIRDSVEVHLK